jgi:hypothetical protein
MRKGAQELEGVPLLLQWIVFRNSSDHLDVLGLQFEPLALSGRIDEFTGYRYRATGLEVAQFRFEILEFGCGDDLKTRETRAIADLEKRDSLRVARGANPAVQRHHPTRGFPREDLSNGLAIADSGFFAHGLGF